MTSNGLRQRSPVTDGPSSTDDEGSVHFIPALSSKLHNENHVQPRLPVARSQASSLRSPVAVLFCLQILSIVPGAVGFGVCCHATFVGSPTISEGNSRLDFFLASLWSIYTAYSSYSLAAGLTRRWLVFYDLGPAMLRLLGLQAFVWPLTHFTVIRLLPNLPLAAWILCALTAALSNNIGIWVTSNIRLQRAITPKQKRLVSPWAANIPYLRQSASRASTRTMDWAKVVRRTVLPLLILSQITVWVLLWQQCCRKSDFPPSSEADSGAASGHHLLL